MCLPVFGPFARTTIDVEASHSKLTTVPGLSTKGLR